MKLSPTLRGAALIIGQYAVFDPDPAVHRAAARLLSRIVEAATPDGLVPLTWTQLGRPSEPFWRLRDCDLISGRSGAYQLHAATIVEWARQLYPQTDWPLRRRPTRSYPRWRPARFHRERKRRCAGYARWYASIAAAHGWRRP